MKRCLIFLSLIVLFLMSINLPIAFAQYISTEEQVKKEIAVPAATAPAEEQAKKETPTSVVSAPAVEQIKKEIAAPAASAQADSLANAFERPATAADIQKAFEKAMIELESSRRKEDERTAESLKEKLRAAIKEWIDTSLKENTNLVNKLVNQNWETLIKYGDPAHYDYYLRDFTYVEGASDIVKTDSITTPYKASVVVMEKLYVERYHTPDASDPSIFFYTFTNPTRVSLEFKDGKFVVVNTAAEGIGPQLDQGWPKAIMALWKKYGDRFRERAAYGT